MKDLSQKPDYEMMWKVECELNKELQEENKILREALEFYAENKNWEQRESGSVKLCAIDPVDHFQHVDKWGDVFWIGGKRACEALTKVGVLSDKEVFNLAGKICKAIKKDNKFEGKPFGEPIKDEE